MSFFIPPSKDAPLLPSAKRSAIKADYREATVELWAMDEHRLGLQPIFRRVWTPVGVQPTAEVNWRFQWFWVYGFVHPQSGETYWWVLPQVNITVFNQVLADLAEHFGLGKNQHILLVL